MQQIIVKGICNNEPGEFIINESHVVAIKRYRDKSNSLKCLEFWMSSENVIRVYDSDIAKIVCVGEVICANISVLNGG